jgi:hypothetical protein
VADHGDFFSVNPLEKLRETQREIRIEFFHRKQVCADRSVDSRVKPAAAYRLPAARLAAAAEARPEF